MATQINNLELYEFLREEVECGIYYNCNTKEIEAWAWIDFYKLKEFTDIVGYSYFSEGGVECRLQENGIAIDLNEIIEYQGDDVLDYKNIFNSENDFNEAKNLFDKYGRK